VLERDRRDARSGRGGRLLYSARSGNAAARWRRAAVGHSRQLILGITLVTACNRLPFGEVLVAVDTNVSVPAFVSALRIDAYRDAGTWVGSRDVLAAQPTDWPISFGVSTETQAGARLRLRLRAYLDGALRDYRGERFPAWPSFAEPKVAMSVEQL